MSKKTDNINHIIDSIQSISSRAIEDITAIKIVSATITRFVKAYLSEMGDINAVNREGNTLLHIVSLYGHTEVVKVLINEGANINAVTVEKGFNALHIASQSGHTEVVKVLIDEGADINAVDQEGWNALHMALTQGHTEVVKVLIKEGVDINAIDPNEETALIIASQDNHTEIVKLLLEKGCQTFPDGLNTKINSTWVEYTPEARFNMKCLVKANFILRLINNSNAAVDKLFDRELIKSAIIIQELFEKKEDTCLYVKDIIDLLKQHIIDVNNLDENTTKMLQESNSKIFKHHLNKQLSQAINKDQVYDLLQSIQINAKNITQKLFTKGSEEESKAGLELIIQQAAKDSMLNNLVEVEEIFTNTFKILPLKTQAMISLLSSFVKNNNDENCTEIKNELIEDLYVIFSDLLDIAGIQIQTKDQSTHSNLLPSSNPIDTDTEIIFASVIGESTQS